MTGRGRRRDSRPDCVFCRIVTGQAPGSTVFEDGRVLAFMDTSPVRRGHVLVIPQAHRAQIWDVAGAEFAAVYRTLPTLVRALARATGADAVNILSLNGRAGGLPEFHLHFHLIPIHRDRPPPRRGPGPAMLHRAAGRAGMISVPCSVLFGADAIQYRLETSGARVLVTDAANLTKVLEIKDRAPGLTNVLCVDGPAAGAADFHALISQAGEEFSTVDTLADEPALLCFTSGTTGPPKGALHAHRTLIGHVPCVEVLHDFFPQPGDLQWSPADWAWLAGLMDVLMPSWFHGVPVLAFRSTGFGPGPG